MIEGGDFDGRRLTALEELEALSKVRSLTDDEVRKLERAVRRGGAKNERWYWSRADDYRLMRYLLRGKKPKQIMILMSRTEQSIWTRIRILGLNVRKIERASVRVGRWPNNCPIAPEAPKCED